MALSEAAVALANCVVHRPGHASGVEVVAAGVGTRSFPVRVSDGLGICLKHGGAHEVTVEGRRERYPANSLSVRTPGCVWASEAGRHGFLSVDLAPELLPDDLTGAPMTFAGADAIVDVAALTRALIAAEDELAASEAVARLLDALVLGGVLASDTVRTDLGRPAAVDDACELLRADLGSRLALDTVASAVGVSKFTLLRRFRAALGTTPHAYLVMVRVNRAQTLLASGATPAEAAAESGFSDQAHMGVWFRRLLGVTPGTYRRSVRSAISLQTRARAA